MFPLSFHIKNVIKCYRHSFSATAKSRQILSHSKTSLSAEELHELAAMLISEDFAFSNLPAQPT